MTQTANIILPQFAGDAYKLQMQQALASQLLGNANQPLQQPVGPGVVGRLSPLAALGNIASGIGGAYMANKAIQNAGALGQAQMGALQGMFGGGSQGAPQGGGGASAPVAPSDAQMASAVAPSPTSVPMPSTGSLFSLGGSGASAAPAPASSAGSGLNPAGLDPNTAAMLYYTMGPAEYGKAFVAPYAAPTDATRMARAAGVDPAQANAAALAKANYIAPITGTGILRYPLTMKPVAFNPDTPAGTTPLFDASGNVVAVQPIKGAQDAMQGNSAAVAGGAAQYKPAQVYDKSTRGMVYSNEAAVTHPSVTTAPTLSSIFAQQESGGGRTAPDNPMQIQQGTFNQYAQPGESWSNPADRTAVAQRVLATYQQKYGGDLGRIATAYFSGEGNVAPPGSPTPFIKNTTDANGKTVASYVGDMFGRAGGAGFGAPSGAPAAGPPLGATTNADSLARNQQDFMAKDWTQQQAANANAQIAISRLSTISDLASKAVIGGGAEKLDYMNHLLAQVGVKPANDAATATDLFNKNVNQITTALTAGGMSTDQARTMVQAAYPNSHMTPDAVREASSNLVANLQMQQAKTNMLSGFYNNGDAKGYSQAKTTFETNADPRLWQLQSMTPQQQAAFVQSLAPADARALLAKRQALRGMGVFR